jgi:hypothetical protein
LLHLIVFLMIATVVIWKAPPPPLTDVFHGVAVKVPPPPPQPPPPPSTAPTNPQMEPAPVTVPVVTPRSTITSVNPSFTIDTSKLVDQALNHMSEQSPQGTGLGPSSGSSTDKTGYGVAGTTPSLVGTLYDLKQTPDHKPTNIAENAAEQGGDLDPNWTTSEPTRKGLEVLRDFVKAWDPGELDKYYKAPNALSATQICIPLTASENAPIAFNVEGTVHPLRWIVIYHARIIPPESGEFRFIGYADDFMVVRMDQQNVLDACFPGEQLDIGARVVDLDVGMGPEGVPLRCGKWIQMEAGTPMDMQVLIGEGPGGVSGFLLMIQKQGDNSPKGDYPVFQVQDSDVPDFGSGFEFSQKKMLFKVAH